MNGFRFNAPNDRDNKQIAIVLGEQMRINESFKERIADLERIVGLLVETVPIGEDIDNVDTGEHDDCGDR